MDISELIKNMTLQIMDEAGYIAVDDLVFHSEIREICRGNSCRNYNTSWACPPAVGSLEECREKCEKYDKMLLFSKKFNLDDSFDFEGMTNGLISFKKMVVQVGQSAKQFTKNCLILSNESCRRCEVCTYPSSPCRFPDLLYPSIEGFGFIVSELAAKAGIRYNNGPATVTFFGAIMI